MEHLKNFKVLATLACVAFVFTFAGCSKIEPTGTLPTDTGIPSDNQADPNPSISSSTVMFPNFHYSVKREEVHVTWNVSTVEENAVLNYAVLTIVMNGIYDPEDQKWLELAGTGKSGQNVWVSIDDKPKGIDVSNNLNGNNPLNSVYDVVFLVDNSGSMGEVSDAVAYDIINWATVLEKSNLDVRFGCVGYGYNVGQQYGYLVNDYGVVGALNITSYSDLNDFFNRSGLSGRSRTKGYDGIDATSLDSTALSSYSKAGGECGVQALRFADENFSFRNNSLRTYINFTDDANYPGGDSEISVEYLHNSTNWNTTKGAIHTVLNNDSTIIVNERLRGFGERPWLMSDYTDGTFIQVPSNFSGVTLSSLPITNVLTNTEDAYQIRLVVDEFLDDEEHLLKLTICSKNGLVKAEKTISVKFN